MNSPSVVTLHVAGDVALLSIDRPPVNAISAEVTAALAAALDRFDAQRDARALVICCKGRTFVAGGDIGEFDAAGFSTQPLNRVLARIEGSPHIVVAAMHGSVLGGGLELALACHYRVALPGTRFGFPEVKLGLLPGSLGTQRLPRLTGVGVALDMILGGKPLSAEAAVAIGIVDEIRDADPADAGLAYAQSLLARSAKPRRTSELAVPAFDAAVFGQRRAEIAERARKYPALECIVRAIEAAATLPFVQGEALEAAFFEQCRQSPQSKAMRHLFFAQREAARTPAAEPKPQPRRVDSVGVVGAGTMGSGIAIAIAGAGIAVTLADSSADSLARGLGNVRTTFEAGAAKGRMSVDEAGECVARVQGTLALGDLRGCDVVIEAVFEDMALKRDIAAALGSVCKPGAILATNTSTLDVDALAEASGRAADFLGMHFFSPANVMRLLEVVRGAATAPDVLATVMELARRIGKQPVVSGVCYGFIGNRMLEPYLREAECLLLEGASASAIDAALESLGLAMGPLRMLDLAGVDVAAKVVIERDKAGALPPDRAYRVVARRLFELGRHGQKTGAGFYRYEGRTALPDAALAAVTRELAQAAGVMRRESIASEEIVERCLYPLINEGVRLMEEGIACRPGDIDVVYTSGYGFPDFRGGPLWMADAIGLRHIVERLDDYARSTGNRYGYWTVCDTLRRYANEGLRLSDWRKPGA